MFKAALTSYIESIIRFSDIYLLLGTKIVPKVCFGMLIPAFGVEIFVIKSKLLDSATSTARLSVLKLDKVGSLLSKSFKSTMRLKKK